MSFARSFLSFLLFTSTASAFLSSKTSFVPLNLRSVANEGSGLQMSYKKVFVAGGTRGVGRCVVEKLVESGLEVVAMARSEEACS